MWLLLFICLPYFCSVESSLAPFVTKCKLGDSKCVKESAIKTLPIFAGGLPNLKVESLDPLKIKRVNASKPSLDLIVTDIVLTGLKGCEVVDVKQDPVAEHLFLQLKCSCLAVGQYDMKGQLLFIPLTGNGPMSAHINGILITVNVDYLIHKDDSTGKTYWNIKTWKYEYKLVGESKITFENLFPNSEELRKSTKAVMDENGNAVIEEMGTPLITAVVTKIVKSVANFFKNVPIEDLVSQ